MSQVEIPADAVWKKSQRSVGQGACVEVTQLPGGGCAMRNSKRRDAGTVTYDSHEIATFFEGVKDGEFDWLIRR